MAIYLTASRLGKYPPLTTWIVLKYICDLNLQIIEKFQASKSAAYCFPFWCIQPENSVPLPTRNFQKFRPEFFVRWKAPVERIYDIPGGLCSQQLKWAYTLLFFCNALEQPSVIVLRVKHYISNLQCEQWQRIPTTCRSQYLCKVFSRYML